MSPLLESGALAPVALHPAIRAVQIAVAPFALQRRVVVADDAPRRDGFVGVPRRCGLRVDRGSGRDYGRRGWCGGQGEGGEARGEIGGGFVGRTGWEVFLAWGGEI